MRILLLLLIFTCFLPARESEIDTALALSYFPLQNGNIWNYSLPGDSSIYWTSSIKETNIIGNLLHYQYCDTSFGYSWSTGCQNIRWDSAGKILNSDGSIWFDFTLNDDDSLKLYYDDSLDYYFHILNRGSSITTPAGVFDSCVTILFDDTLVLDDERLYKFAPGVGIVRMYFEGVPPLELELLSAYINGKHLSIDELPTDNSFHLYDNYPNPFNPLTTIRYELPRQIHVRLAIFDLLGREVAVLVDAVKEPGINEVVWDAGALASGIYFYQLQTETKVITEKMVLLK